MKILMSPSKEMHLDNLENTENTINSNYFHEKVKHLKDTGIEFDNLNILSKKAIKLYNGLAFRQLQSLDEPFYQNIIILSSLYGYSFGTDYISHYRLDYTTTHGRLFRKEFYEEINKLLVDEDIIYNLASNEFSKGINHQKLINFEFLVEKDGTFKNISATSKKLRGLMVEYIRKNGDKNLKNFNEENFTFYKYDKTSQKYIFVKS